MDYLKAKKIMGKNFIGPAELAKIKDKLKIKNPLLLKVPPVPFNEKLLKKIKNDYLLVLGSSKNKTGQPLTINVLRKTFGLNPIKTEPCFYNQDWYLKEKFATQITLADRWYLIAKKVKNNSRGASPGQLKEEKLPSAIMAAYAFFAYYFLINRQKLWVNDFIWCSDKDHNGDQIYVGRYLDPNQANKNGFNIHRHLTINKNYGVSPIIL